MRVSTKTTKPFWYFIIYAFSVLAYEKAYSHPHSDSAFFQTRLTSFAKGNNHRRLRYLKNFPANNQLTNLTVKTQAIDWLGLYRNVIIEKKGQSDSIVYIVCHYDKIDGNIFSFLNLMLNGSLDILFSNTFLSKGAYDNGTGTVTSLSILEWINNRSTHYTYRFLFAGMEEYGLRGSRRHVSSLSKEEWTKCVLAINIDMIAEKGTKGITLTKNVSHPKLVQLARKVSDENDNLLTEASLPVGALSDFHSFQGQRFTKDFGMSFMANLVGAFIPQRSYFTKRKEAIPVINFSDDTRFGASDMISAISPVSFGTVHSLNDKLTRVSFNNLATYSKFMKAFLESIDHSNPIQANQQGE